MISEVIDEMNKTPWDNQRQTYLLQSEDDFVITFPTKIVGKIRATKLLRFCYFPVNLSQTNMEYGQSRMFPTGGDDRFLKVRVPSAIVRGRLRKPAIL